MPSTVIVRPSRSTAAWKERAPRHEPSMTNRASSPSRAHQPPPAIGCATQAQLGGPVDRRDAGLADDRAAPVALGLDPVGEQDADRAGLGPGPEGLRAVEPRVVA